MVCLLKADMMLKPSNLFAYKHPNKSAISIITL